MPDLPDPNASFLQPLAETAEGSSFDNPYLQSLARHRQEEAESAARAAACASPAIVWHRAVGAVEWTALVVSAVTSSDGSRRAPSYDELRQAAFAEPTIS